MGAVALFGRRHTMHTQLAIHGWSAGRSGPGMTVKGRTADGQDVKVPNVKHIGPDGTGAVIATDVGNQRFKLVDSVASRLIERINGQMAGDEGPSVKLANIRMLLDAAI
jgi:hypothetical protein